MKNLISLLLMAVLSFVLSAQMIQAQESSNNFKDQFTRHFNYASRVFDLAEAMPAETYSWQPEEGVFSIERVFTHIARYNYYYLEQSLGIPAPDNVDVENIESITGKENVLEVLEHSIEHVNEHIGAMPESKLEEQTEMYGQSVNGQAVLMQLITHMSEHVGQAISYARINGVAPPWSE